MLSYVGSIMVKLNSNVLTLSLENDIHILIFFMENYMYLRSMTIILLMIPRAPLEHCPHEDLAQTPPQWQILTD